MQQRFVVNFFQGKKHNKTVKALSSFAEKRNEKSLSLALPAGGEGGSAHGALTGEVASGLPRRWR
ncbi:MAG: hypothetical protein II621_04860 [Clostridia bacterium]|nr:hypothetical protein [Clostridia bacterium]